MNLLRRLMLPALLLGTVTALHAHHGWAWTDDGQFELSGRVTQAQLGNPHGVLKMNVNGRVWTVEVGQPWRNERAGLSDAMLGPGAELTIIGKRAVDPAEYRVKAERVRIGSTVHDLYLDRK